MLRSKVNAKPKTHSVYRIRFADIHKTFSKHSQNILREIPEILLITYFKVVNFRHR